MALSTFTTQPGRTLRCSVLVLHEASFRSTGGVNWTFRCSMELSHVRSPRRKAPANGGHLRFSIATPRNVLKTDNRPMDARNPDREPINMTTLGGHYIHNFETAAGQIDVLFWGVGQLGTWGTQDHRAGAMSAEAGYQPPILGKLKPWIRGGYFYGSGDDNPSDDKHNTFFEILPTPRWYARFPFFNLMNNDDIFGQLMLHPHQKLSLRAEVHSLRLASRNDLWYLGGGAFQPWTFGYIGRPSSGGRGLATLFDVSADYNVGAGFSLTGYYAVARGKSVVAGVYPDGRNGHLGYVELTYRF